MDVSWWEPVLSLGAAVIVWTQAGLLAAVAYFTAWALWVFFRAP